MQKLSLDRNKRKSRPFRCYKARPLLSQNFPLYPSSDEEGEPFDPTDAVSERTAVLGSASAIATHCVLLLQFMSAGAGPANDQREDNQTFPKLAADLRLASQMVGRQPRRNVEGTLPRVIPAPHSQVLPEQYVEENVRAEYDACVALDKNDPAEIRRSYMFPTDRPYTCVCTDNACLAELETTAATFASCLAHDPQAYSEKIQFMAGFWGEDGKIYCKEVGSAEEIKAMAQVGIIIMANANY